MCTYEVGSFQVIPPRRAITMILQETSFVQNLIAIKAAHNFFYYLSCCFQVNRKQPKISLNNFFIKLLWENQE